MDPKWYHVCRPRLTPNASREFASTSWAACRKVLMRFATKFIEISWCLSKLQLAKLGAYLLRHSVYSVMCCWFINSTYLLPGVRWLSMPSSSSSKTAHSARETSDRFVLPIKFGVKPSFGFKIGIMLSLIQNPKDKVTLEFGLNWVKTSHFLRNWGVNPLLSRS